MSKRMEVLTGAEVDGIASGVPELYSINVLESLLEIDKDDLRAMAEKAHKYYKQVDFRRLGTKKWRHLDRPREELKNIQAKIQRLLLARVQYPNMMFGSIRGRSIRDNAEVHVGQKHVLTVDLKNCFPNTTDRQVFNAWMRAFKCSSEVAAILTSLTTFRYRLPQGSPTSPLLANLALIPMYTAVAALAERLGLRFSFFVDDIAISGVRAPEALASLIDIIHKHGHAVSRRKVNLMPSAVTQRTPGVTVNSKVSNGRERISELRSQVFVLVTQGILSARDLSRINGLVYQASYVCPEQGASLKRFTERLLIRSEVVEAEDGKIQDRQGKKLEYRSCESFTVHRRRDTHN
ncbi:reverse transcriptase family protein [Sorangium sp. So ce1099]|uniref:reverse transcriptase family protein n=1 Tax=Sorangium sp. So ce1099 TaxID=3133331 RepID=UPI003F5F1AC7